MTLFPTGPVGTGEGQQSQETEATPQAPPAPPAPPAKATQPAPAAQDPKFELVGEALRTTGAIGVNAVGAVLNVPVSAVKSVVGAVVPAKPAVTTAAGPAGERPTLRQAFEALQGVGPTQARLLDGNVESWVDRWVALRAERDKVDSFYFSVEQDAFGYAFLGALLLKRKEGVPVRLGTDAVARAATKSFTGIDKDYLQELVNHGAKVRVYHPITRRLPHEFLSRDFIAGNHDKILRLGSSLSYVGGRNIGRDYYRDPLDDPKTWRDLDVRLEGEAAARGLTAAFEAEFNRAGVNASIWPNLGGNWIKRDIELIGATLMMDAWVQSPTFTPAELEALKNRDVAKRYADELVATAVRKLPDNHAKRRPNKRERDKLRDIAAELVQNPRLRGAQVRYEAAPPPKHQGDVAIIDRTSEVGSDVDGIAPALKALGGAARDQIFLINPYVVLTDEMIETMAQIGKNGTHIYLGTNSPMSTDSALTQAFFLQDWPKILARVPKLRLFVATGERKFHAKAAVADATLSLVSTYNLDFLSAYINSEVGALVWSPAFAAQTTQAFLDDKGNPANGVVEYTIERDADGKPILRDGAPIVKFGPQHHLTKEVLDKYRGEMNKANAVRSTPWTGPLRR